MRIVIDARFLYATGVGRYLQGLLANLQQLDHDNEYVVLMRRVDWELWQPTAPNFRRVSSNINPYTFGEQFRLAWQLYRLKPDLVHYAAFNGPVLYLGRHLTTIHDLTLVDHRTSRYSGLKRALQGYKQLPFRFVLWFMVKTSAGLITPSQFVKDEIIRHYRVRAPKITVTLEGFTPTISEPVAPDAAPTDPFILYTGNYYPYKNVDRLVRAYAKLHQAHPHLGLVMTGRDDFWYRHTQGLVAELGIGQSVAFYDYVSDQELAWLYDKAEAYIFPSLSEGFGLGGLEAMAYGTPVIAARASCLPEVYGDAAAYFDPLDVDDIAAQIAAVIDDPKRLEQLGEDGKAQAARFSWEEMTRLTLAVYRQVGKVRH